MDVERIKAFLRSYQRAKRGQLALQLQLEELESAAAFKGVGADGMPHSHEPHDLSGIVVRIAELRERNKAQALEMVKACEQVSSAIGAMSAGYEREVLTRRYINGQKWEQIAEEMHMALRSVHRYHGMALHQVKVPEGWSNGRNKPKTQGH